MVTSSEIAALISNEESQLIKQDLIIQTQNVLIKRVNENHSYADPLHYVLMLPRGEQRWQYDTYPLREVNQAKNKANENDVEKMSFVSEMQYYAYQLHKRPG